MSKNLENIKEKELKKDEIIKAYNFRRAIKKFTDQKISDKDFDFIMETARLSPSSFGWEPWQFLVVQNKELRTKLTEFIWGGQGQVPTASHFVILLARRGSEIVEGAKYLDYKSLEVDKLPLDIAKEKEKFFINFQNNEFDLTDERKRFDWACKQTYIPLGNMMTAAAEIGIDSCPIEGFDPKKVEEILVEAKAFDPSKLGVSVMVTFGYRESDSPYPRVRFEKDDVIKWIK